MKEQYTRETWPRRDWPNFTFDEFACSCCDECWVDPHFMNRLQLLRFMIDTGLSVTSGYRCSEHPDEIDKDTPPGSHHRGRACDIAATGGAMRFLTIRFAIQLGFTGIGVHKTFVHLDDMASHEFHEVRPVVWTY